MTECPDCPYRLWPTWCAAASGGHRALCRPEYREILRRETLGPAAGTTPATTRSAGLTVEQSMRISTCAARISDCHCVAKPALCRRDGPAREVLCITAGPKGGPCPGVAEVSGRG